MNIYIYIKNKKNKKTTSDLMCSACAVQESIICEVISSFLRQDALSRLESTSEQQGSVL